MWGYLPYIVVCYPLFYIFAVIAKSFVFNHLRYVDVPGTADALLWNAARDNAVEKVDNVSRANVRGGPYASRDSFSAKEA